MNQIPFPVTAVIDVQEDDNLGVLFLLNAGMDPILPLSVFDSEAESNPERPGVLTLHDKTWHRDTRANEIQAFRGTWVMRSASSRWLPENSFLPRYKIAFHPHVEASVDPLSFIPTLRRSRRTDNLKLTGDEDIDTEVMWEGVRRIDPNYEPIDEREFAERRGGPPITIPEFPCLHGNSFTSLECWCWCLNRAELADMHVGPVESAFPSDPELSEYSMETFVSRCGMSSDVWSAIYDGSSPLFISSLEEHVHIQQPWNSIIGSFGALNPLYLGIPLGTFFFPRFLEVEVCEAFFGYDITPDFEAPNDRRRGDTPSAPSDHWEEETQNIIAEFETALANKNSRRTYHGIDNR